MAGLASDGDRPLLLFSNDVHSTSIAGNPKWPIRIGYNALIILSPVHVPPRTLTRRKPTNQRSREVCSRVTLLLMTSQEVLPGYSLPA